MDNPLIAKLEQFTRLSTDDRQALDNLASRRIRQFTSREDIVRQGDGPDHVNLFLTGWGMRYKALEDGRRQIMAIFLPGDICDVNVFILRQMDHSIATLTSARVAEISRPMLEEVFLGHPRITLALWWDSLVTAAIQREWTLNLGQRSAWERLAHLFCELFIRLRSVGLTQGDSCEMPLTQSELADAAGLSTVHVNRTLRDLRSAGLLILRGRSLTIPDLPRLMEAGEFNPDYLHLDHEGGSMDANR